MHFMRPRAIAGAIVAAAAIGLGAAPTASAVDVTGGHWDVGVEFDCATQTFGELHAHNEDTGAELPIAGTVFRVTGTSNSSFEASVFGAGALPVKVIGDGGTYRLGFAVEADGCTPPNVTFRKISNVAVAPGGRVAGYLRTDVPNTRFDSTSGTGRNLGLTINDHVDPRWGFTALGTYTLRIRALSGGSVIDTADLTFGVS
jgi:hypothetical protein